MADGGYHGDPGLIMPYRKPANGAVPGCKHDLDAVHKCVDARVKHSMAHMKSWNIRAIGEPPRHRLLRTP